MKSINRPIQLKIWEIRNRIKGIYYFLRTTERKVQKRVDFRSRYFWRIVP
jgi:hypothetical protein